jgi:hypothetical protein
VEHWIAVSALERGNTTRSGGIMDSADDALRAYENGRADGLAGKRKDEARAEDPDYLVGLVDGQVSAFEENLLAAIRRALDGKKS